MTSTILTIGIPTLAVLVGILMNRNDANRLDAKIAGLDGKLNGRIDNVNGRIDTLASELRAEIAAARKQSHDDVIMLMGVVRDLDTRTTRLEGRH